MRDSEQSLSTVLTCTLTSINAFFTYLRAQTHILYPPEKPSNCTQGTHTPPSKQEEHRSLRLLARARQPSKPHHRLQLQHVLLPHHYLILLPELLRQLLTPRHILRAHKIDRHLDTIREIRNLRYQTSNQLKIF